MSGEEGEVGGEGEKWGGGCYTTNHQRKSCYIISVVLVTMVALVTKVALVNQVFGSVTLSVTLPRQWLINSTVSPRPLDH